MAQAFKLRLPEDLRTELDRAAEKSGRSLNSEIVARLETSCRAADTPSGSEESDLLQAVRVVMQTAGRAARRLAEEASDPAVGAGWPSDPYAYDQAVKAAVQMLEMLRPAGSATFPGETAGGLMNQMLDELGAHFANAMLGLTRNRGPSLLGILGPLADRLPKGDAK
jgi:hypothetical protein